ncbi:TPA: type III secretion system domain-containing protein [Citrobacter werkmanii]
MLDDKDYLAIFRLYVCPGEFLHEQYWTLCSLSDWRDDYLMFPTLRTAIDRLLRQRLGWEWYQQHDGITECQRRWIRWLPKLPVMLISLGLMSLNSVDYFLLGDYRRVLNNLLGEITVKQLFSLWQGESEAPIVSAEELPDVALSLGLQFYLQIIANDWVGKMIIHTLPPIDNNNVELLTQSELESMNAMLLRIGRFV